MMTYMLKVEGKITERFNFDEEFRLYYEDVPPSKSKSN